MFNNQGRDSLRASILGAERFSFVSNQGRGSSSASTLGTDWPSHVEIGTRLFESIDTWGKMVQFCVTRDEAIPEHRYLGKTGCVK